jgi:hypothetical protein
MAVNASKKTSGVSSGNSNPNRMTSVHFLNTSVLLTRIVARSEGEVLVCRLEVHRHARQLLHA